MSEKIREWWDARTTVALGVGILGLSMVVMGSPDAEPPKPPTEVCASTFYAPGMYPREEGAAAAAIAQIGVADPALYTALQSLPDTSEKMLAQQNIVVDHNC